MNTGTGALGFFLVLAAVAVTSASASAETHGSPRFHGESKGTLIAFTPSREQTTTTSSDDAPSVAAMESAPRVTPPSLLEAPKLRRMRKAEISPAMLAVAARVVRQYYTQPAGTQVEVDVEGQHLYARIEVHYHPEGGPVKPWGLHHGVSLFCQR